MTDCGSSPCFCCCFSSRCSLSETHQEKSERERPERETSWFSRAAGTIWRVLSSVGTWCCPSSYKRPTKGNADSPPTRHYETHGQRKRPKQKDTDEPLPPYQSLTGLIEYYSLHEKRRRNESGPSKKIVEHQFRVNVETDSDESEDSSNMFYNLESPSQHVCCSSDRRPSWMPPSEVPAGPVELQTEALVEMEESVGAVNDPVTSILPSHQLHTSCSGPGGSPRGSSRVPGCVSMPSLNHMTGNQSPTPAASLPDMKLPSSLEEFTPGFSEDHEDHESYRFQCSCPGLYQCSVTGLVFDMEGEGDVVYRTLPWNWRLLVPHHKKPAGPLFDIQCLQQSVRQLHLPHCQIRPTAGFLAVAHVSDDGVEFISPQRITETHVVIDITGFSAFGNVKDEDSPPDPVRALVLLFYRPPDPPDVSSVLNVLLLPKNVSLRDVQRSRRKLVGDERYIETSPHCKLHPDQVYTLSTAPEDDSVLVQPTQAEFDAESYDNYFPTFQVILETTMKHMKLFLRDGSSNSVWERRVCLSSAGQIKSCGSKPPNQRLLDIRSCLIDGTSGPVLNSLLDKLLDKKVLTDSERESADEVQNRGDKARFVIDTVRKKGDAASSEMIEFLCELDPFLCEHLDLM